MSNLVISNKRKAFFLLVYLMALVFMLIINGAVPFVITPTLGQAVWTTGFSQSYLNQSLLSIYAHNFGGPEPAPIAFGLAGAYPAAIFMAIGMHAADAYTSMIAVWLLVAFYAAYRLSRFFSVNNYLSVLAALTWCTMPMIWGHAGYSMLSTGIALLPLYILAAFVFFTARYEGKRLIISYFLPYLLICIVAIFMDGYTFMMFASSASVIGVSVLLRERSFIKKNSYRISLHFLSFAIAYLAYALFIGESEFEPAHLDFFRGWGVDMSFWFIPSAGIHWIPDLLGLSHTRTGNEFFGDSSVWKTTFVLPLILGVLIACIISKKRKVMAPLIIIAFFGFYMSLGPSFKFNSTKPSGYSDGPTMGSQYAIAPTGTALLSEHLPGFKNMRASYRWAALGVVAVWALIVLAMSSYQQRKVIVIAAVTLVFILITNLPNPQKRFLDTANHRLMFKQLDEQLLEELKTQIKPNEAVAFLPFRNDFLVNYLAAKLDIKTFNIGGDKNLEKARSNWPDLMQQFQMGVIDEDFSDRVALLLLEGYADVVVMPYIDLLWSAHVWPSKAKYLEEVRAVEKNLLRHEWLEITQSEYYAIVRLREGYEDFKKYESLLFPFDGEYPFSVKDRSEGLKRILQYGWYQMEPAHVWSSERATLKLLVPEKCHLKDCTAVIKFFVYGASHSRPVELSLASKNPKLSYKESIIVSDSKEYELAIPLRTKEPFQVIELHVPNATSPMRLSDSADRRILGIALTNIDLKSE